MGKLGRRHPGLPDDLVNFHWDPVACAVAVAGRVRSDNLRVQTVFEDDVLRFAPADDGQLIRVVTDVDGEDFAQTWLTAVESAQRLRAH